MASTKRRRCNPIGFTPWPVTVISLLVYLALFVPLIIIQHVVPSAPKSGPEGIDLEEAWHDLQHLTAGFHPYNSHRNDEVHDWLLQRIHAILDDSSSASERPDVFVFDDNQSNLTYSSGGVSDSAITGVYFEGTNIIVYIRGSEDDTEAWWERGGGRPSESTKSGVLVNAHYDSVSTGFGATDDGMGVVSLLQLIRYFSSPGNHPRRGLVLLFNNGEEDFLNGAHVFGQHPMSRFTHTFLNLEGAGAGGRAVLFRSTDTEVTRFYKGAAHPFGNVLAGDGFKMGLIRSQTDYVVFNDKLGLRGLDVAFMEPRARYHTDQDDARHTSVDSLWHMLSAAISTTEGLVSYTGSEFEGKPRDDGKVSSGEGTIGVWFDLFGSAFAVFRLNTLFILSVLLLVATPLVLLATSIILCKQDKMYLFAKYKTSPEGGEKIPLRGLRGLIRYPTILILSSALPVGLAYLFAKVNPLIVYSSSYSVLINMASGWVFLAWFVSCIADFARPSALQRAYSFTWLFVIMWALLVVDTVYQKRYGIAAGYFIFFYFAGTFLATWISYLEFFALPRKSELARQQYPAWNRRLSGESSRLLTPSADELPSNDQTNRRDSVSDAEEDPTESTSLLRGRDRPTFANYRTGRSDELSDTDDEELLSSDPFGHEQTWSSRLPAWTWILQFLLLGPIVIILIGQLTLLMTSAMYQTGADGGSTFTTYLGLAVFSILLFIPLSPFVHRFTYHIPTFLLLVFVGTVIYNCVAFPFSLNNRLKLSFLQEVDLDSGKNQVSLTGMQPFVTKAIHELPSAAGKDISCDSSSFGGRHKCSWEGPPPNVIDAESKITNSDGTDWLSFNVTRNKEANSARFEVSGKNTKSCRLLFDSPVADFTVLGAMLDDRMPHIGENGVAEIRLWSRTWENTWTVDVEWGEQHDELSGRVLCIWSDNNSQGVIPALDEIRQYAPIWVAITKLRDGLVEASRSFRI